MEDDAQLSPLTHDAEMDSEYAGENGFTQNNMLPSVASGLLGGVSSLFNTLLSAFFTQRAMSKQHEYNVADWNMQNEYNSPKAQMERMLQAGISPAAAAKGISGNGSASNGINPTAQGSPQVFDSTGLQSLVAGFPNLMLDQRNSQVQRALNQAMQRYYNSMANEKETLLPHEIRKIALENLNLVKAGELTDTQKANYIAQTERLSLLTPIELEKFLADIDVANAMKSKLKAETKGVQYDNVVKAYESAYITAYHAKPDSGPLKQFVQMCMGGDEQGGNVFDAFVGTVKSVVKHSFNHASEFFEGVKHGIFGSDTEPVE